MAVQASPSSKLQLSASAPTSTRHSQQPTRSVHYHPTAFRVVRLRIRPDTDIDTIGSYECASQLLAHSLSLSTARAW